MQAARDLVHGRGAKLLVQLHGYMETPSLSQTWNEFGFWANAKILPDWRALVALADEVVLKNYNHGTYSPDVARGIKDLCAQQKKPLWVHCYLQQGHDWNPKYLQALDRDERVSGVLLYEVVWNKAENDGLIRVEGDEVSWVFE